jgi:hypothetical protein
MIKGDIMNYRIIILFSVALFAGCVKNDAKIVDELKELKPISSVKNNGKITNVDWKHLLENSKLVVVGNVEETLYVVDENKLYEKKPTSTELPLPNLREGVKGLLIRFHIEEILYAEKNHKVNETVNIYVKDGYAPPMDSDIPIFTDNKKYLVFLSPAKEENEARELTVIQPLNLSKGSFGFDYKTVFTVTEKSFGKFALTESNETVNELKSFLEKRN